MSKGKHTLVKMKRGKIASTSELTILDQKSVHQRGLWCWLRGIQLFLSCLCSVIALVWHRSLWVVVAGQEVSVCPSDPQQLDWLLVCFLSVWPFRCHTTFLWYTHAQRHRHKSRINLDARLKATCLSQYPTHPPRHSSVASTSSLSPYIMAIWTKLQLALVSSPSLLWLRATASQWSLPHHFTNTYTSLILRCDLGIACT